MVHANHTELAPSPAYPIPSNNEARRDPSLPSCEISETLDLFLKDELETLHAYQDAIGGDARVVEHPIRVVRVLHDFADKKIAPEAYAAALLHDIAQDLDDPARSQQAARALFTYKQKLEAHAPAMRVIRKPGTNLHKGKRWEEVVSILADLDTVEEASEIARFHDHDNSGLCETLRSREDIEVPAQLWDPRAKVRLVDSGRLQALVRDVTPQAIFVKAAEMYDNLTYRPPSDRALFQDVYDTLSFYAPVMYIKGFDAFESALKTVAEGWQMRLSGGYEHKLENAEQQIDSLGSDEHCMASGAAVLKHLLGADVTFDPVITNDSKHNVLFAVDDFSYTPEFGPRDAVRAIMRRKGITSTVKKNEISETQDATDLLGMTLIAPNRVQMIKVFGDLVVGYLDQLAATDTTDIMPASSPSRQESIHVSGPIPLITAIKKELDRRKVKESAFDELVHMQVKHFKTAKVGLNHRSVDESGEEHMQGMEIQVQSEADRKASRVDGLQSHLAYKNPGQFKTADLRFLNSRRYRIGIVHPGATTAVRVAKLEAQIATAA